MSTGENKGPGDRYSSNGRPASQWYEPLRRPELISSHYSFKPGERQMARAPPAAPEPQLEPSPAQRRRRALAPPPCDAGRNSHLPGRLRALLAG